MAAKLPDHLRESEPRRLSEMQVGQEGYVGWTAMTVAKDGECFLDPNAELRRKCSATIGVKRKGDGFHVIILSKDIRWRVMAHGPKQPIPVITITEEYDPDLDGIAKLRAKQGE